MVNHLRARWWRYLWLLAALACAVPIGRIAIDKLNDVTYRYRAQLIVEHRLWELHPEFKGSPEAWTRFASRLLTDRQLASRLKRKYAERSEQFELDYRRDLSIAQGEVIVVALAIWGVPAGIAYLLMWFFFGRRPKAPPAAPAASHAPPPRTYDVSRYRRPS